MKTRRVFVYYKGFEAPCHISESLTPSQAEAERVKWAEAAGVTDTVIRDRFGGPVPV